MRNATTGFVGLLAVAILIAAALVWDLGRPVSPGPESVEHRPIQMAEDGYVSSDACRSCHPHEYDSWHGSYHRRMTQVATPDAILAPLDTEIDYYGHPLRLSAAGDEVWAEIRAPGGTGVVLERTRVVLTTGSHHAQVFWLETDEGRSVRPLPVMYRTQEHAFVPFLDAFLAPGGRRLSGGVGSWNVGCVRCHTTRWRPRRKGRGPADTRVAEFGIACEACHAEGEEHVRVNQSPLRRYAEHFSDDADSSIVNPKRLGARAASEVCGQCHSVYRPRSKEIAATWAMDGDTYRPGGNLHETRVILHGDPEQIRPHLRRPLESFFWPDGAARVSGREYSAMLDSPCIEDEEFGCSSCHVLHPDRDDARDTSTWADDQLAVGMRGNDACLGCHAMSPDEVATHTRHEPGSSGRICMNCHMPYTTYGLLKATRSHTISSPNFGIETDTGRPNACNLCHLDRSRAWGADELATGWGVAKPPLDGIDRDVAAGAAWVLTGDAVVRALGAWHMGRPQAQQASGRSWMRPLLAELLADPYPAVRWIAHRSLTTMPGFEDLEYDPMTSERDAPAWAAQALTRWHSIRGPEDGARGPATLVADDGTRLDDRLRLLRARRDDRVVDLQE